LKDIGFAQRMMPKSVKRFSDDIMRQLIRIDHVYGSDRYDPNHRDLGGGSPRSPWGQMTSDSMVSGRFTAKARHARMESPPPHRRIPSSLSGCEREKQLRNRLSAERTFIPLNDD
jgi:hypothetical protein